MNIRLKISFEEKPALDAAKNFVLKNLDKITDDDFTQKVFTVISDEIKKTIKFEVEPERQVIG